MWRRPASAVLFEPPGRAERVEGAEPEGICTNDFGSLLVGQQDSQVSQVIPSRPNLDRIPDSFEKWIRIKLL